MVSHGTNHDTGGTTVSRTKYPAQATEAFELLAGLLYTSSPDPATPEGRIWHKAKGLLLPLLDMNEQEVGNLMYAMHLKHGTSFKIGHHAVEQCENGRWRILDEVDEEEIFLTADEILQLATQAGVIA